jgi:hypothetical protein
MTVGSNGVIVQISLPAKCGKTIVVARWPNIALTGGGSLQVTRGCVRSRLPRSFDSRCARK